MLARGLPGFQYVNNTDFPKALGNSATIAGVVRKRLRAPLELRLCLASFRGMMDFVFKPSLRLVRDVTVCTLDDAIAPVWQPGALVELSSGNSRRTAG